MNSITRKIVALAATAVVLGVAYYGSWLPFAKSSAFITALKDLATVKNIGELKQNFDVVFTAPSPIGEEELIRNFTSIADTTITNVKDPKVVDALVQYVEKYYQPVILKGKGMSFNQNLYAMGRLYQEAFLSTHDPHYLQLAAQAYLEGERLAPNRPQFLYGLFDVYRIAGDVTGVTTISQKILSLWPNDTRIPMSVQDFEQRIKQFEAQQKAGAK